ncbi:MAG: putative metal-dependent hydrolase [Bacteroidia bacterium]|nr:putative metal-dependent hydrolase [Bacteroidia bacterium]NNK27681.1 putative metal-dependent hydrolase [Flavobacteriaceae bacterium]
MTENELEELRYPIGRFQAPDNITNKNIKDWIIVLEQFPEKLSKLVSNLDENQLNTPYRKDGWTVRQVVHHVSDSHHHSYTRFKWALTEDKPIIKAYNEQDWAELFDTRNAAIQMSLDHLRAIHFKLVHLLRGLSEEQLNRSFIHPEGNIEVVLKQNIGIYAWHSNHHYAHIENLLKRKGW